MVTASQEDLRLMLLIRRFEERLLDLFAQGLISGTTHTCLGQEYIPVALAPLLRGDFVLSNHRGHGHFLAHCGDLDGLLAEVLGRAGGVCDGVGGSQHLRTENFLSTGVQGESVPVAAGIALHYRQAGLAKVAAVYTGDGTWGEGAVYEGLNIAALWGLPLLVLVEDNQIAQSTPTHLQLAGTLAGRAAAFGLRCTEISGHDVTAIRDQVKPVVDRVRAKCEPQVVVFRTSRLGPHSKGDDTRTADELSALRAADWLVSYTEHRPDRVAAADAWATARLDAALEEVLDRPQSSWAAR